MTLITEENGEQDYENMCIHNVGANFCTDNSLSFPREEILEEAISSITKDVSNYQEELKINSTIEKVKKDIKNLQISRKIVRDIFKKKSTNRMKYGEENMQRVCKRLHWKLRIMKILFRKGSIHQSFINETLSDVGGLSNLECGRRIRRKIILQRRFLTYQTKRLIKKKEKLMNRLEELRNVSENEEQPQILPSKGQRTNDFTYHVMMAITIRTVCKNQNRCNKNHQQCCLCSTCWNGGYKKKCKDKGYLD